MTIAPDFNTQLARLLGGEADMIEQVPAANVAEVSKDTSVRSVFLPGLDYNFIQLNLRDRKGQRAHPVFGERELRRALTAAIDRAKVVENAYQSLAAVAIGPTVRAYPTTDTTLRQIGYAPDAAKRTLDSLGWKDSNGDGVRERNGVPLAFKLAVPGSSKSRMSMAVLIQEQLTQVGAKVDIEPLERAAFVDMQTRRDFDALIGGWHAEASPGGIRQTWGSAGSRTKGGNNYGSYENAVFDAHVDSAMASSVLATRRAHFTKAYQTIIDDAPAIWLAEPRLAVPVHKRFNTPGMRADAWWINIADWTIPADKRIARDRIAPAR
jgi:peptide/nickel transport system substrate-binding protein